MKSSFLNSRKFDAVILIGAALVPASYAAALCVTGRELDACIALSAIMGAGAIWLYISDCNGKKKK